MQIATWNVNSLRARAERVRAWLARTQVEVLAIQETKCKDSNFPEELFTSMGYEVAHWGANQWNGVAIASRVGLSGIARGFPQQPLFAKEGAEPQLEPRALSALCGGARVWSLYVPHGRGLEDPHMGYKLAWLARLREHISDELAANPHAPLALAGDWNIAPRDEDVWDATMFHELGLTHVSAPERAAFRSFHEVGLVDPVRPLLPGPDTYTFWDYQQLRFPRNEGMRIDFILTSPALSPTVCAAEIDRNERKGKGASDHAPVVITAERIAS